MSKNTIFLLALTLPGLAFAADKKADAAAGATAESTSTFICESPISYSWKRKPVPLVKDKKGAVEAEPVTPQDVFFQRALARAKTEAEAKSVLKAEIESTQAAAMRECDSAHGKQGTCVSRQLKDAKDEYRTLDYAARRALLQAITEDCTNNVGTCIGAKAGEAECREDKSEAEGEKPGDKKDGGKDAKKK